MKTKLHKLIGTAVLGLALVSHSLSAWAGNANRPQVTVGTHDAYGSMAGARYSADSQQYIGCRYSNTTGPYVICLAKDNTGKSLYCTGFESRYLAAAKAITDSSFVKFGVTPGSAYCTKLEVTNNSYYLR
jgi:hypothetical protein